MAFFSDFQYGFRSSRSTADLLTVVSDRIARAFNRSGATPAVALNISKAFDRVWHAGLLHKLKCYGISGQIFGLISSFLSNRRLGLVLDGKSSKEYPVNAGVPQGSILGPTLFLLYIRRKKLHRTNQGSNFLGGSFGNRGNLRAPIQFRRESQPQHLKMIFPIATVFLDRSNETS